MAEDWRVTATLDDDGLAAQLLRGLNEHEVEWEAHRHFHDRVAVSGQGSHVFVYAAGEAAAREAEGIVRELANEQGLSVELVIDQWHPLEERWEDVSVPLPRNAAEEQTEHARLAEDETQASQRRGLAEWEVRLDLPSHREAVQVAERLEAEGMSVVRRWTYLVVGANNEDEAKEIAARLERELPSAEIRVEPGPGMHADATQHTPFASMFNVLGF